MSIRFSCPHCLTSVSAPDGAAGHFLDCPVCDRRIEVPANEPERKGKRGKVGVILAACFFGLSIIFGMAFMLWLSSPGNKLMEPIRRDWQNKRQEMIEKQKQRRQRERWQREAR